LILIDTNVLVALVDDRDPLHARAATDLRRARRQPLRVLDAVLSEAHFLLPEPVARNRLWFLLIRLAIHSLVLDETWWPQVQDWLEQYAEHEPDFADAQLVVATSRKKSRVWTYDREFTSIWRRLDGSRVPLLRPD
jgi:predicted nucleic acid-binding protein